MINLKKFQLGLPIILSLFSSLSLVSCTSKELNKNDFEAQVVKVLRDNPEIILESVEVYQEKQEKARIKARVESLQKTLRSLDNKNIIGESPTLGSKKNEILIVEFSDFQCPFCAKANEPLKQFLNKHSKEVTFVYKHLPLNSIHPEAMPAAKASWAANQQGKFWEYHDALFANQSQLGEELYLKIARDLKIDLEKFNQDRNSEAANLAIQKDIKLAEKLGVDGTPFILVNGTPLFDEISPDVLEDLLKRTKSKNNF